MIPSKLRQLSWPLKAVIFVNVLFSLSWIGAGVHGMGVNQVVLGGVLFLVGLWILVGSLRLSIASLQVAALCYLCAALAVGISTWMPSPEQTTRLDTIPALVAILLTAICAVLLARKVLAMKKVTPPPASGAHG